MHRIPSPLPSIGTQTRQVIVFFPRRRSPFSYFKEVQVSRNPTFQFWFWQRRNATRRNKDSKKHLACVNYGQKWPTASLTHCHPVCQTWRFRGSHHEYSSAQVCDSCVKLNTPFKPWLNTVFFLGSIVDSIPACHAGDRGSIPRRGERMILSYATSGWLQSKGSETRKAACSNITKTEKMTWWGS